MPGDIRLGLALHLAQDGGLVTLLNGHHGGIFRERNFLCAFRGKKENNAILMIHLRPTAIPALTIYNQIEGFTMQTALGSFAGPIALVGQ